MSSDAWSILFCLIVPICIAIIIGAILLWGWRVVLNTIGNTFVEWIQKK